MPIQNTKITAAAVASGFRPATVDDFIKGLQYYRIKRENVASASGNVYSVIGETVGETLYIKGIMAFVEELRFFLEGIIAGEIYIATSYTPPA